MDETPEFVVSEGRAYHRGDVVLLRLKGRMTFEYVDYMRSSIKRLTDKTGVEFVLLDETVEVVEPRERESDG